MDLGKTLSVFVGAGGFTLFGLTQCSYVPNFHRPQAPQVRIPSTMSFDEYLQGDDLIVSQFQQFYDDFSAYGAAVKGSFSDENETMLLARLLHGEARQSDISDLERVAIAYTVVNRENSPRDREFGEGIHGVILNPNAYSCMWDTPRNASNFDEVTNPTDIESFARSYAIAHLVLSGQVSDPTDGAVLYYNPDKVTPKWNFDLLFPVGFSGKLETPKGGSAHNFYMYADQV